MTNEFNYESYKELLKQYNGNTDDNVNNDCDDENGEYNVALNEIDINDYVLAENDDRTHENLFKNDIGIINILTLHYKKTFNVTKNVTLFDGIKDVDKDTNKCMEFVYGEIFRYNESVINDKDVLYNLDDDIDLELHKEFYCLMINGDPIFMSPFILPLVSYLATLDWVDMDWEINNIL